MAVTEVMFSPIILSFSSSLSWIMEKLYFEILHIKPFSQNDIQFIGEADGYTQGVGLSYSYDFDSFKDLMRKIFTSEKNK